ncbi:MAG: single-stranded-DNA-specific exonuclease RecJ [Gammaproteobacteria bacterium]
MDWPAAIPSVLQRIYQARAVRSPDELNYQLKRLLDYAGLKGMDAAVERLLQCLQQQQRVLIVGDFDADGATSTALAVRALRAMGLQQVDYLVPNRFEYGYGLTPEIVAVASRAQPDLIITVDNGISSIAGVEAANAQGIEVLVTDHHLPGEGLPAAVALVNPNQPGDDFASKNLAGVGVIFYVMMALRARLRALDWFARQSLPEPNLAQYLDLVALGTVADVVPLDYNNRILVSQGLARIRSGQCCPGILSLLKIAGRDYRRIAATDLGFCVGPRLNAAGRLEDMSLGIECLLSDTAEQAMPLAAQLDALNQARRSIETDMQTQALVILKDMQLNEAGDDVPVGVCLFDEDWHEGVIGILASRIKERLHRPVIAFAPAAEGMLKGSARSIPGVHIRDVLDSVAAHHPSLLQKFGGHAMAAGLTLAPEDYPAFTAAFDAEVRRVVTGDLLTGVIHSDGDLSAAELNLHMAQALRDAGPWGQGFPEPTFDGEFEVVHRRIVGERHLKLQVRPLSGTTVIDAIAFNTTDAAWPPDTRHVHLAYRLDVNEFNGKMSPQLLVEQLRCLPGGAC